jgi:hypothetical protein
MINEEVSRKGQGGEEYRTHNKKKEEYFDYLYIAYELSSETHF